MLPSSGRSTRAAALALLALAACAPSAAAAAGPQNVLVIINRASAASREIGEHYIGRRKIPPENVCLIRFPAEETIPFDDYPFLEKKIAKCLGKHPDVDRIRYLVTTKGVPLRTRNARGTRDTSASVDSELTLLYRRLRGEDPSPDGPLPNPFFAQYLAEFRPEKFRMYPVTRLTGYTVEDAKALVDRALETKNRGLFIFDASPLTHENGNRWLRAAARALPQDRVLVDEQTAVLYEAKGVIGYAGWGSNDKQRLVDQRRWPAIDLLPGAIVTEYVSTDGRTFQEPPDDWRPADWAEKAFYHAQSPQSLTGDWIRLGAAGASGHTDEPYLQATPRPNYLFPSYYAGRPLAESYWLSIPYLSWRNVVVGDPLCRLPPPP